MNVIDYDRKMRVNVRNSAGPKRTVLAVDSRSDANYLTLSCGHIGTFTAYFQYRAGEQHSCFQCRFAADNVISEESLE